MKSKALIYCLVVLSFLVLLTIAAVAEEAYEGQTIHVVGFRIAGMDELMAKVPEFEKKYNINVEFDMLSMGAMRQKMRLDFEGNTKQIDVALSSIHITPTLIGGNNILPLNDFLESDLVEPELLALDDYFPAAIDAVTYPSEVLSGEDKIWGLPFHFEVQGLMYRKSVYEKYNLKVPTTWEEYIENAKIICEGEAPDIYGLAWRSLRSPQIIWAFSQVFRGFGGKYFVNYPTDLRVTLDNETTRAAFQYFKDTFDYAPPGSRSWAYTEVITALSKGIVAQSCDDLMYARYLEDPESSNTVGDWGYAPIPIKSGLDYDDIAFGPAIGAAEHWVINADISDVKKQAAFKFIQWATSKPVLSELAATGAMRGFLTRISMYEVQKDEEWVKGFLEAQKHSSKVARPKLPEWVKLSEVLATKVSQVIIGEKEINDAVKELQKEFTTILEEAGRI